MFHILISKRLSGLAFIFLLLAGCANVNPSLQDNAAGGRSEAAYAQTDLDELLSFGADFARTSSAGRAEVCKFLLSRQGPGIQLHLLTGRLLSDACGDIPKVLAGVNAIPAKEVPDEQTRQWLLIQAEALKRMGHASKRLGALERKQKNVQSVLESKDAKRAKGAAKDDARLLREKLDAIRAMEKKLDEADDGN
jgi:hypothetical protein